KGRLNSVVHLGVGMHRAFALDLFPARLARHAPRASCGRWITQPAAIVAGLQVEIVLGTVLEVRDVLDIEVVNAQPHAHVVAVDRRHYAVSFISSSSPRKRGPRAIASSLAPGPPLPRG